LPVLRGARLVDVAAPDGPTARLALRTLRDQPPVCPVTLDDWILAVAFIALAVILLDLVLSPDA
jgi:hypothetical protein